MQVESNTDAVREPTATNPEVEELAPAVVNRRMPKSSTKPPESSGEDVDDDVSDTDSAVVEEAGQEAIDTAEAVLSSNDAAPAILQVSGADSDGNNQDFLEAAQDPEVTDFDVQVADAGTPTTVTSDSGKQRQVKLGKNEKSREVKIAGETTLVLNSDLSAEEASDITTDFIVERLESLAEEFGVRITFDPFFSFVVENGFESMLPYLGNVTAPTLVLDHDASIYAASDATDRQLAQVMQSRRASEVRS